MSVLFWLRSPRCLLTLFLAVMLVLSGTLAWLGWRFVEHDRALERQRSQERLENAADLVAASLLHSVVDAKDKLARLVSAPESDLAPRASALANQSQETAVVVVFRQQA